MEKPTYERTLEDVQAMIKLAKLDERKLTEITQAIYNMDKEDVANVDNLKLLELNPDLLHQITEGQTLYFKGALNEKVVICTSNKTYEVKEAEISNSLLLIPDLKFPQETSTSPIKSPNSAMNRSKDDSTENIDEDTITERRLDKCKIVKVFHEYLECREIQPRYRKLGELLQLTRYSGPENEHVIDKNLLFTYDQLLDTTQCSEFEFIAGLKKYRAIKIDDRYRVMENEYEYRIVFLMIGLISENSWHLDDIDKQETIKALEGIAPDYIVEALFDLYTKPSTKNPDKYEYHEDLVCQIVARNILRQGLKFHVDEFLTTWQEALPEGMFLEENYLRGIGIIDRTSAVPCVRALDEQNMPTSLLERLQILFKTKQQWSLDEIEPYIDYFSSPSLTVSSILAKYARAITVEGQRLYVSKH